MNGVSHMKYMLLGGAGLFGVLLVAGVPLQSAVLYAVVLACPLMMVFMMGGGHGGHSTKPDHDDETRRTGAADQRTSPDATHRHH